MSTTTRTALKWLVLGLLVVIVLTEAYFLVFGLAHRLPWQKSDDAATARLIQERDSLKASFVLSKDSAKTYRLQAVDSRRQVEFLSRQLSNVHTVYVSAQTSYATDFARDPDGTRTRYLTTRFPQAYAADSSR